ncbi:PucR family transcriptional regulator [Kribbella sp. CWNU-51]
MFATDRTVESLLDRLGSTVVDVVHLANGGMTGVRQVLIGARALDGTEVRDGVLLGCDVDSTEHVAELLEVLGPDGLAALVLAEKPEVDRRCVEKAERYGVTLLRSTGAINWSQLAGAAWQFLEAAEPAGWTDSFGTTTADLFRFATTVSSILGAPVTIEDLSSTVVAFSPGQEDVDPARTASILSLRVPERWQQEYRANGVYGRIYRAREPVLISSSDGILARLAVGITAGTEALGSMWAAVATEPTAEQLLAFQNAANSAALLLLRRRHEIDPELRRREQLLLAVLDGGAAAAEAARGLDLDRRVVCIIGARAVGQPEAGGQERADTRAERTATLHKLRQSLALQLSSTNPKVSVVLSDNTVYAAFPLPSSARDTSRAEAAARAHVTRACPNGDIVLAVGRLARTLDEIPLSRADADGVLDVLCNEPNDQRVATIADFQGRMLLRRMRRHLAAESLPPAAMIEALREHDAVHSTGLLDALDAYLDCFGNVGRAARRLSIHPNTLRYRMQSVARVGGIDLEDSGTRFELMLQLRLRTG